MKRSLNDAGGGSRWGRLVGLVRQWMGSHGGFSMPEMLMAVMIMGVVAGTTLQLMSAAKFRVDRGSEAIELEQQARQAIELLVNDVRHAGLSIFINRGSELSATRQHSVVEASPHRLAFYSDTNPQWYSPMPTTADSTTWLYGVGGEEGDGGFEMVQFPNVYAVTFPDATSSTNAQEYFDHIASLLGSEPPAAIPEYVRRDAEVVLYTMDTNDDGQFTGADEDMFEAGATPNPADVVVRRQVFYTRLEGGAAVAESTAMTVARGLRVMFDGDDPQPPPNPAAKYAPPFVYHLSERYSYFDINGDGDTNDDIIFGDCHADPDEFSVCGDGKLGPKEMDSLTALSKYSRTDLADNVQLDTRLGDVLTRIRNANRLPDGSLITEADAKQFLRNMISHIEVNFLVEAPDARPNVAHPTWSTPEKPYRYVQHVVQSLAYLPNAFFISKNQLLSSEWARDVTGNDGNDVVEGGSVYDPTLCTYPDDTPCWPAGPGGDRDADTNDPGPGQPGNGGGNSGGNGGGNDCGDGRINPGCGV